MLILTVQQCSIYDVISSMNLSNFYMHCNCRQWCCQNLFNLLHISLPVYTRGPQAWMPESYRPGRMIHLQVHLNLKLNSLRMIITYWYSVCRLNTLSRNDFQWFSIFRISFFFPPASIFHYVCKNIKVVKNAFA